MRIHFYRWLFCLQLTDLFFLEHKLILCKKNVPEWCPVAYILSTRLPLAATQSLLVSSDVLLHLKRQLVNNVQMRCEGGNDDAAALSSLVHRQFWMIIYLKSSCRHVSSAHNFALTPILLQTPNIRINVLWLYSQFTGLFCMLHWSHLILSCSSRWNGNIMSMNQVWRNLQLDGILFLLKYALACRWTKMFLIRAANHDNLRTNTVIHFVAHRWL